MALSTLHHGTACLMLTDMYVIENLPQWRSVIHRLALETTCKQALYGIPELYT